jgi:Na+-transporting methylmalonyl-CoA/oxaloacetate decarboxylase gamma subunit
MMTSILATVAAVPEGGGAILTQYVPYQIVGLGVVMVALGVLYATCALVGGIFRRVAAHKPAAAVLPTATTSAESAPEEEATDPRVIAAIAAAITVTLEQPCRIIEIHEAGHSVGMSSAWAIEGRFQHFSSHKIR